jgi:uncharacterized protein with FMN-binding domain
MRRVILAIVSTAAGLIALLSFKTHSATATPPAALSGPAPGSGTATGSGGPSGSGATRPSAAASPPSVPGRGSGSAAASYTGAAAETIYGPIQVKVTVRGGKLTAVQAVEYPDTDPHDAQINAYAIPALNQEALRAGSARIDAISGATYTSEGYITSLQSALDKAGQ